MKRGVVGVLARGGRLLVIRRSRYVRAPLAYCFPGGSIEPGESEAAAVERELFEELALPVRAVRFLFRCVTRSKVDLAWWAIELIEDKSPEPLPAEVDSAHWLTIAQIRALEGLLPSNHEFLDALARGEFAVDGLPET